MGSQAAFYVKVKHSLSWAANGQHPAPGTLGLNVVLPSAYWVAQVQPGGRPGHCVRQVCWQSPAPINK